MQEFVVVRNETFSGRYPLKFSEENLTDIRALIIDVRISRPAKSAFFSNKTFPSNGFVSTMLSLSEGLALSRFDIEYAAQRFFFDFGTDRQLIPMHVCILKRETLNLSAAIVSLGGIPIVGDDAYIESLVPMPVLLDGFNFVCYADVALNVQAQILKHETCRDSGNPNPPPPKPKPPQNFPSFTPGTPITNQDYSPPPPGSGDDYEPYPGDGGGGNPPPPVCGNYEVSYLITNFTASGSSQTSGTIPTGGVPTGTFSRPGSSGGGFELGLVVPATIDGVCVPGQFVVVFSGASENATIEVSSVVEV